MRVKTDAFFVGEVVNGVHGGSERGSRVVVNGVHGGSERGSPEIKGKYNTEIKDEIQLSPQAALVTLHTPDQIENTFVHVVEQISLEEEKTKIKTSSAGPYENKETPALQNAGHFEASVPPNPPPTQKKRKPKTEGHADELISYLNEKTGSQFRASGKVNIALVNSRIKEGATVEDLKLIIDHKTAQWGTDPKMTEYLCPETLFRAGHYEKYINAARKWRDGITVIPAERYSLEDCPQAKTPGEFRDELSRFYNTHKALLSEAQQLAETNYGPDRLRSIVTDFCSNRISKSRQGETFGQHHAALGAWLKRQKEFDAKNEAPKHAGPQGRQLFSAAPVNYSLD